VPKKKTVLDQTAPLNVGQRTFCKYLVQTKKIGRSAERSGYNKAYGSFLLAQPKIQNHLQQLMDNAGLTDPRLAELIHEGATAMTPVKYSKEGGVLQKEHPDFYNRKDYIKMAMQSKGHLKPDFQEGGGGKVININLNIGVAQGLLDSGAISKKEYIDIEELSHEPIRDEQNE
jgi:hypothetical protein